MPTRGYSSNVFTHLVLCSTIIFVFFSDAKNSSKILSLLSPLCVRACLTCVFFSVRPACVPMPVTRDNVNKSTAYTLKDDCVSRYCTTSRDPSAGGAYSGLDRFVWLISRNRKERMMATSIKELLPISSWKRKNNAPDAVLNIEKKKREIETNKKLKLRMVTCEWVCVCGASRMRNGLKWISERDSGNKSMNNNNELASVPSPLSASSIGYVVESSLLLETCASATMACER